LAIISSLEIQPNGLWARMILQYHFTYKGSMLT
jgi:hypothetical protein